MSLFQPVNGQTMYPPGPPQFHGRQMPMPSASPMQGDMSVMQTQDPSIGAAMPTLNDVPDVNSASEAIPTYVGNPILDKYIHMFMGAA